MSSSKKKQSPLPSKSSVQSPSSASSSTASSTDGSIMVQVLLQSSSKGAKEGSADKVLLSNRDMKMLRLRVGSLVTIEAKRPGSIPLLSPSTYKLVCRAWPSKTLPAGHCTLNRIWIPYFPSSDHRTAILTNPIKPNGEIGNKGQLRISPCSEVVIGLCGLQINEGEQTPTPSKPTSSSTSSVFCNDDSDIKFFSSIKSCAIFKAYLQSSLMGVMVSPGLLLRLSWQGRPLGLEVYSAIDRDPGEEGTEEEWWYSIEMSTKFRLVEKDELKNSLKTRQLLTREVKDDTKTIHEQGSTTNFQTEHPPRFHIGGYSEQAQEAWTILQLALSPWSPLRDSQGPRETKPDPVSPLSQLLKPPKGLLLHGPPGTGKSRLMHKLAKASGFATLKISHDLLLRRFVGEAESELKSIFQEASTLAPCIILIDNIDLLCRQRSSASELQRRLVSCMLTLVDGVASTAGSGYGDGVFIIATSSQPNNIDQAMRRPGRLDKEIEIGVPSASQRLDILKVLVSELRVIIQPDKAKHEVRDADMLDDMSTKAEVGMILEKVASQSHGMVGSDLLQVLKEAHFLALMRNLTDSSMKKRKGGVGVAGDIADVESSFRRLSLSQEGDGDNNNDSNNDNNNDNNNDSKCKVTDNNTTMVTITDLLSSAASEGRRDDRVGRDHSFIVYESDLMQALGKISPSALKEVVIEVPRVRWHDIGGMDTVKQSLKEVVEWPLLYPHLFQSLGIAPPRGVMLYGPPGCSKTLMAKALATESSMNFLAVRGPELLSKWLGESEKAVQTLFRRARAAAPSIVFFDEIDALAGRRGESSAGVNDRVLSQLLTELDGIQGFKRVIVIAATNRPDLLDSALMRPGRFDRKIYVPPPDEGSRQQIIEINLKPLPLAPDVSVPPLVQGSQGFSGAEVASLCSEAAMLAIEEGVDYVFQRHLMSALSAVKPQITPQVLSFYASIEKSFN